MDQHPTRSAKPKLHPIPDPDLTIGRRAWRALTTSQHLIETVDRNTFETLKLIGRGISGVSYTRYTVSVWYVIMYTPNREIDNRVSRRYRLMKNSTKPMNGMLHLHVRTS